MVPCVAIGGREKSRKSYRIITGQIAGQLLIKLSDCVALLSGNFLVFFPSAGGPAWFVAAVGDAGKLASVAGGLKTSAAPARNFETSVSGGSRRSKDLTAPNAYLKI